MIPELRSWNEVFLMNAMFRRRLSSFEYSWSHYSTHLISNDSIFSIKLTLRRCNQLEWSVCPCARPDLHTICIRFAYGFLTYIAAMTSPGPLESPGADLMNFSPTPLEKEIQEKQRKNFGSNQIWKHNYNSSNNNSNNQTEKEMKWNEG